VSSEDLLSPTELASLLASRICHDVVSPVGAVINGLELLESDDSPETRELYMQLVAQSARQASASLQFMRLAFGAGASAGSMIDLADAGRMLEAQFEHERADLALTLPVAIVPRASVKVLLNLAIFAIRAIPRGGTVTVTVELEGETPTFSIVAEGVKARVPDTLGYVLGEPSDVPLDPHSVQPYLTGLLAREVGLTVTAGLDGDCFTLDAR
tara:strand:+ start:2074 stop:2709 length:636 start_codon:yes stop_codon:yes gene_type:complete